MPVVDDQGRQLVDGGLVANVPVTVARSLGADIVIAVDVNSEGAKFLGRVVFDNRCSIAIDVGSSAHRLSGAD